MPKVMVRLKQNETKEGEREQTKNDTKGND
jgi:hypothetical protein